jgi:hypothetical protein
VIGVSSYLFKLSQVLATYLSIDELQISGTLRITVSGSILGTGLVGGVLLHTAICVHGHEVQSTIESAGQVGYVNIKSELLVTGKLEHLIGGIVVHEVGTRADVR